LETLGQHLASHVRWEPHPRASQGPIDHRLPHEGNGRITALQGAAGRSDTPQLGFAALQIRIDV
jgi:hypothetical protein